MVIAEYRSKGATVLIDDRYMAARGSVEERNVIEEQRRAAHEILVAYAAREAGDVSA